MNASVSFSEDGVIFHVACARSARGLAKQICEQVIWSFASDDVVSAYVAHARARWKADATGIAVRFLLMPDDDKESENLRKRQDAIVVSTIERLNHLLSVIGDFDDYVCEFLLTTRLGEAEKPILNAIHDPQAFNILLPLFFDKLRSVEVLRSRKRD